MVRQVIWTYVSRVPSLFLILILLSIMLRKNIIYYDKERPENLEGVLPMYFDNQVNA